MKLYGTTTSPFVRRVRVVAAELGEAIELISTAGDAGQALLREVTPIRKVPAGVVDGQTIFDSRAIIDYLVTTRGWGQVAPPRDRWVEANLLNAIDAAIESLLPQFLLARERVSIAETAFARRQDERVDAIFAWVVPQLRTEAFGLPELSLVCALEWMAFRKTYPVERAGADHVLAAWAARPSLAATRPQE